MGVKVFKKEVSPHVFKNFKLYKLYKTKFPTIYYRRKILKGNTYELFDL